MSVRGFDITDLHYREVPDDSSAWDATPGSYDPVSAGTDLGKLGRLGALGDRLLARRRIIYADATNARLKPTWKGAGWALELRKRIGETLAAIEAQRKAAHLTQPPVQMTVEAQADLKEGGLGQFEIVVQTLKRVAEMMTGVWDAQVKEAVARNENALNLPNVIEVVEQAAKAFADAGGTVPGEGEVASDAYAKQFQANVRKQFKGARIKTGISPIPSKWPISPVAPAVENRPQRGWYWHYINALRKDLKNVVPALREIQVAHLVQRKVSGKETVEVIGEMVLPLVQQGVISQDEVSTAVSALTKLQQGYALTEEESKIAGKLRPHLAPKAEASKWALPAAVVGIPALLYAL